MNRFISKRSYAPYMLILAVFLCTGCAKVSPYLNICIVTNEYGFFSGIWHGFIVPFSWISSLFGDTIAIYASNNTGGWYDFGFVLGLAVMGSFSRKLNRISSPHICEKKTEDEQVCL